MRMIAMDQEGWRDKQRPFTFSGLPSARTLELIVKMYPDHHGVTEQLGLIHKGASLLLNDVFGTITYKGKGTFFAAGAGITPFLAIFRDLKQRDKLKGNELIYSNKTGLDVIMDKELGSLLGKHYLKIFTRERVIGSWERRIDRIMLITLVQDFDQHFYLCGPQDFATDLSKLLLDLGAKSETLVFES